MGAQGRAVRRGVAVGLVALVAATAGTTAAAGRGAAPVESIQLTLVDDRRATDATPAAPGRAERVLETTITYPVETRAPVPLIVLAHGHNGHPRKFVQLMDAWAEAGYVVAAPAFPLTNDTTPGGSQPGDVANQPADVSFVIDELLRMGARGSDGPLAGRIDKRRVGVAGLSLGGATVYGLAFNTCCRDRRIDAVVLMSAIRAEFDDGRDRWRHVPALLLHGDADPLYRISVNVYPMLATPKWFVTLPGSTHSGPFEDSPDPADGAVPVITVAFWDRYLKGERAAQARLVDAVDGYDDATSERKLR